ncbi:uncharacterized protein BJX67DRAFT_125768 [Aspergillus lucknowensis]|uniref:Uncharacterized protein n=1 Tax=Aspergillus lucknowensis TaxID=176173 RepID=A0ABR4LRG2_9EURO
MELLGALFCSSSPRNHFPGPHATCIPNADNSSSTLSASHCKWMVTCSRLGIEPLGKRPLLTCAGTCGAPTRLPRFSPCSIPYCPGLLMLNDLNGLYLAFMSCFIIVCHAMLRYYSDDFRTSSFYMDQPSRVLRAFILHKSSNFPQDENAIVLNRLLFQLRSKTRTVSLELIICRTSPWRISYRHPWLDLEFYTEISGIIHNLSRHFVS